VVPLKRRILHESKFFNETPEWTDYRKYTIENGRYGHAPIRSDTSIRVYATADTDTDTSKRKEADLYSAYCQYLDH